MDDLDDEELRSLPCSNEEVKWGWPAMVQLQFVDAGLKKNPHPREDFYRQYSPERQTREAKLTSPPPLYSPGTVLQKSKDWAAKVAKGLKQFHAGRVMLRKEEGEQSGDLEKDPKYWDSKAERWQDEIMRLIREIGKRKKLELKGEAEEGYAQAMLLSPPQSPFSCSLSHDLPEVSQSLALTVTISHEAPETSNRPSQPEAVLSQEPLLSGPDHSPRRLSTPPKGQKRTCSEIEDQEKERLEDTSRVKRQRKEATTAKHTQDPVLASTSTQSLPRNTMNTARIPPKQSQNTKGLLAKAVVSERNLPWKLRSRNRVSYRETGTRTKVEDRSRQAEKSLHQRASRGQVK